MSADIKLLFLDDNIARHKLFLTWYRGGDHCYGYDDCVRLLSENKYDVVSLDHDLSENDEYCVPGVTNKGRTGTDVAKFIAQLSAKPNVAIIHSYNPIGAAYMAEILRIAGVVVYKIPFGFNPDVYRKFATET